MKGPDSILVGNGSWETVCHATGKQVVFYREHGYLKFGRIFTREEIDALRTHVEEMITALPLGKRPEEMDVPHFEDPWLFRYLANPRVLDVIEDFIGPDIVLWSSHLISKPPWNGRAVSWHTDGAYWKKCLEPTTIITLWLAVDESCVDNGCMRVIPDSHRQVATAIEQYQETDRTKNVFGRRIPPELIDESKAVDLELAIGECHFHDAWIIHGSNRNMSGARRCGSAMRYMPANVYHRSLGNHKIYLLRGRDCTGGRNVYTPVPE